MYFSYKLSQKIVTYFLSQNYITQNDQEAFLFCLSYCMDLIIYFFVLFIVSSIIGIPWHCIIFFIVMFAVRGTCGGYHASSRIKCSIISTLSFVFSCLLYYIYWNTPSDYQMGIMFFFVFIIFCQKNTLSYTRTFTDKQKINQRRLRKLIACFLLIIYMITYQLKAKVLIVSLLSGTAIAVISILIAFILSFRPWTEHANAINQNSIN